MYYLNALSVNLGLIAQKGKKHAKITSFNFFYLKVLYSINVPKFP